MNALVQNGQQEQKGFTLIELVIVIIILGILAATVVPKFIDLTGDAHAATLNGIAGAINSANSLTYGKTLIKKCPVKYSGCMDEETKTLLHNGSYYAGSWDIGHPADPRPEVLEGIDLDTTEWTYMLVRNAGTKVDSLYLTPRPILALVSNAYAPTAAQGKNATKIIATNCYLKYTSNYKTQFDTASTEVTSSGC